MLIMLGAITFLNPNKVDRLKGRHRRDWIQLGPKGTGINLVVIQVFEILRYHKIEVFSPTSVPKVFLGNFEAFP